MRSMIRLRILIMCGVLVAAGAGGWQLLSTEEAAPITVGTTDRAISLDPAGGYDTGSWALYSNLFQSLLTFRPGVPKPVPDAAEKCEFVGSGLTVYRCELRGDLSFSNGRRMTVEDVEYSFARMLRIKADTGPSSLFQTLKSVTGEGNTITFTLGRGDATFPLKLATGAGSIVDRDLYPADQLRPGNLVDGSGPYVLKEYEADKSAFLALNPRYRGAITSRGGPVVVNYYAQPGQLATAWKDGQVKVAHRQLPSGFLDELDAGGVDSARVTEADTGETHVLNFNLRPRSPMSNKAVRQAVAAVIDRPAMVSRAHHSTVEPLYSIIPRGFNGHSTAFFDANPEPDAEKARRILKDAGVRTPVSFSLSYRREDDEAAELKRQLERTRLFKVEIADVDSPDFTKEHAGGADAYVLGWLPDFPDSDNFTGPLVGTGNAMHSGYSSKRIDELIAATQRLSDRGAAAEGFKAIQTQVAEDVPLVPLWQRKDYVLAANDIGGSQFLSDDAGIWRLWELGWV
ncbi:ABC transporter substrate-binding protein [Streptomyces sp. NPDC055721]|uniref:ABC transporter substrate-binding protein n=1 Tax=Streptomyces sp. NPDC127132 TaxID=3345374 RepID=UPI003636D28F